MPLPVRFNAELLNKLLEKEMITPARLARKLGVSRSCVSRVLNGHSAGTGKMIFALLKHYPDYPWLEYVDMKAQNSIPGLIAFGI